MAKLTLNNITSGFATNIALNANFDAIETALENTLSRDGTTPNFMTADLDMNSNSLLNISTFEATTISADNLYINGELVTPSAVATSVLPDPTGQNNKVLKSDTTSAAWETQTSDDVIFTSDGTGAVATTVQAKLRESVSVKDFGAIGDGVTDDTAAIQAAVDYAISSGNYEVIGQGGTYKTTATIIIGSYVILRGVSITCATNDIPIIQASKEALNSFWQVKDLTLRFASNQAASNTEAVGIRVATTNTTSFEFVISDVTVVGAVHAIDLPELTGCHAFLGKFSNIRASSCSSYAYRILGSTSGASTNLTFDSCYAVQTVGSEISGSAFGLIKRTQDLTLVNCAADHCQGDSAGRLLLIHTCIGRITNIAFESCDIAMSSGTGAYVEITGSYITIGSLKAVDNNVAISGSASYGMLRCISSSQVIVDVLRDSNTGVTDTSSGAYYTILPDSTTIVINEFYTKAGTTPTEAIAEFGTNTSYSVRRFNGNWRTDKFGSKYVLYGTAIPTTGTWAVGDTLINTAVSNTSPVHRWACTVAGTPGTWKPSSFVVAKAVTASRPTLTATDLGVMHFDTTLDADGKPIWWTGIAWVDATGATV